MDAQEIGKQIEYYRGLIERENAKCSQEIAMMNQMARNCGIGAAPPQHVDRAIEKRDLMTKPYRDACNELVMQLSSLSSQKPQWTGKEQAASKTPHRVRSDDNSEALDAANQPARKLREELEEAKQQIEVLIAERNAANQRAGEIQQETERVKNAANEKREKYEELNRELTREIKKEKEEWQKANEVKSSVETKISNAEQRASEAEISEKAAKKSAKESEGKADKAYNQMWLAYGVATCVIIACVLISGYFGSITLSATQRAAQSDKRIIDAEQKAAQQIADAEAKAENRIAEIEAKAQKKIADTDNAKYQAVHQAQEDARRAIARKSQELEDNFKVQVAAVNKKEKELDTKIKENDDTKKALESEREQVTSDGRHVADQIRRNNETQRELAATLKVQQAATSAAEQSKKKWEERLNQIDIDVVAFDNFVDSKSLIKNGYWYWRGRNTNDEPILGAAKIIGISDSRIHLEDIKRQRFSVYIRSLTKEQQALIGLLLPQPLHEK